MFANLSKNFSISHRDSVMNSTNITEADREDLIVKFSIYVGQGVILIVINFAMLLAILRRPILRKQYAILGGLFLTDGLAGCATLSAGVGRLFVLETNTENEVTARRDCMFKIWNLLFIWSDPMCSIMLLVVSIDRLLAIGMPIRYFKASGKLGYLEVFVSHAFMACCVIIGWAATLLFSDTEKNYSKICWSSESMNTGYFIYHTWLRIATALLSVVLYFIVVVMMRIQAKKVAPTRHLSHENLTLFSKRQLQFTVSMGISCLFTCSFYISPICVELYTVIVGNQGQTLAFVTTYSLIISNLSPISSAIILFHRHKDIRQSLLSFISCGIISSAGVGASMEAALKTAKATARKMTSTVSIMPLTEPERQVHRSNSRPVLG